jgi:hypothetical protein
VISPEVSRFASLRSDWQPAANSPTINASHAVFDPRIRLTAFQEIPDAQ